MKKFREFLRDLWFLAKPYFQSEERWLALGLLVGVIGLTLLLVYINVEFNEWNGRFYDALQNKNEPVFWAEIKFFTVLALIYISVFMIEWLGEYALQLRWRRWMTRHYLSRWFTHRAYYEVELERTADNPDQRISEDVRLFIDNTVTLTLGLLSSIVTFVSFVAILWTLSGPLSFVISGAAVNIPGYMVWVALLYAIAGTTLAHLLGRPLIPLNFRKEKVEADFRFELVRTRENAEAIALYEGERHEEPALRERFQVVLTTWWAIIRVQMGLIAYTAFYNQLAIIFPFLVASPRYFAGTIMLGGLMRISSAFGQVQGSLSFFVSSYARLAQWRAVMQRLRGFHEAIEAAVAHSGGPKVERGTSSTYAVEGLTLALPNDRTLVEGQSFAFQPNSRTLVMGPSGSGKSTLFRALAGIWPFGSGKVRVPEGVRSLFLPQKTYLPIASLRDAVRYPDPSNAADDNAVREVLRAVRLEHLENRLDEVAHWGQRLSPGEQQRLAIARALLYKPDWLFLDEATASVDEEIEKLLYGLLHERLPNTTIVSIGHRPSLRQWHDNVLALRREGKTGKGQFVPV